MKPIVFYKLSGSGNDFIVIDNRMKIVDEKDVQNFVVKLCRRKMSVGADGLILVENATGVDFKWRFYNSDGSSAQMCGNGARCVARFACLAGIAGSDMSFETGAGIVYARVINDRVKVKLTDPENFMADYTLGLDNSSLSVNSVNTGVPHVVVFAENMGENLNDIDVVKLGRQIRFHDQFAPAGTNVNFVCLKQKDALNIRTYERGVEDETMACGTGAVAAAIVTANKFGIKSPVRVSTKSKGYLNIYFKEKNGKFFDIYLEGDARVIYKGEIMGDALGSWK